MKYYILHVVHGHYFHLSFSLPPFLSYSFTYSGLSELQAFCLALCHEALVLFQLFLLCLNHREAICLVRLDCDPSL